MVQILNEVPDQRNRKNAKVAAQGVDMIRTGGDLVDECGRMVIGLGGLIFATQRGGPYANTWAAELK